MPATPAADEVREAEPVEVEPGPESYPHLTPAGHRAGSSHAAVDRAAQLTINQSGARSGQVSDFFPGIAWLIPFFPLLGAGVAVLGPRRDADRCAHSGGRRHRAWRSWSRWACSSRPSPTERHVVMSWLTDQQLRGPHRVSHRRPDHDDAVDGDVRLVAGGRLTRPATWPATRAIAGSSP